MNTQALCAIKEIDNDIPSELLDLPCVFEVVAARADEKRSRHTCTSRVTVKSELKVRHGCTLALSSLRWLVIDQPASYSLLRRPVF